MRPETEKNEENYVLIVGHMAKVARRWNILSGRKQKQEKLTDEFSLL